MKKAIVALLTLFLTLSISIIGYADPEPEIPITEEITEDYQYTFSLNSSLSISNKNASCISTVKGYSNLATKVNITHTLQKKNGSSWNFVTSWTQTFNNWYGILNTTKSSLSSGTYRLKVVAKVYSGNNYETISFYSNTYSC